MFCDLHIVVPASTADMAAGRIWTTSPLGIRCDEQPDGVVRLVASYPGAAPARDAAASLADMAPVLRAAGAVDWAGVHAGRPPVRVATRVLHIDAGPTFGWGGHPTTRLVLDWLARHPPVGRRVLDVGCGSGVLAVAAAVLGANTVLALDVDPAAVAVTTANADANGVAAVIEASVRPMAEVTDRYDVVVANVDGDTQVALAGDIARCCPSGPLCLSGYLTRRSGEVEAAHRGRRPLWERTMDGWASVVLAPC